MSIGGDVPHDVFRPGDRVRLRRRNQPATVVTLLDNDFLGVLTDFHASQGSKLITLWHRNEVDRIDEPPTSER